MVVTAQKREENLQAVPISISALSATDIERRGVQNCRRPAEHHAEHGRLHLARLAGQPGDQPARRRQRAPSNLSNDPGVASTSTA
jgi:hypothetical protein